MHRTARLCHPNFVVEFRKYVSDLQRVARIPAPDRAIASLRAFFATLAERLQSRDALDISRGLPTELATYLLTPPRAAGELFTVDDFVFRVATRAKIDIYSARDHTMIIGGLLREHLSQRALDDLLRVTPDDLAGLLFAEPDEEPLASRLQGDQ